MNEAQIWSAASRTLLLLVLGSASFIDLRTHSLPLVLPSCALGGGILLRFLSGKVHWPEAVLCFLPGLFLLLLALLSRQAVGYGDGAILLSAGAFLDLAGSLTLLFGAMLLSALFCGMLLLLRKARGTDQIPFVPFLLGGYDLLLLLSV